MSSKATTNQYWIIFRYNKDGFMEKIQFTGPQNSIPKGWGVFEQILGGITESGVC